MRILLNLSCCFVTCFIFHTSAHAQSYLANPTEIDSVVYRINSTIGSSDKQIKRRINTNDTIGQIEIFRDSGQIVLIRLTYRDDSHNSLIQYFYLNRVLIYIEQKRHYLMDRFYFKDEKLITWIGPYGIPKDPNSEEFIEISDRLIQYANDLQRQ